MNIPSVQTPTAERIGANKADYEKFVVVDTKGHLGSKGDVVYSLDLVKDTNLQVRADFLEGLFQAVEMEFKVREARQDKVVKAVSATDLLAKLSKGN